MIIIDEIAKSSKKNMAVRRRKTKDVENLKKLKGPGTLRNMTFIIQLYTKNGRENVIFTSLDNSFCEIIRNSEECAVVTFPSFFMLETCLVHFDI